MDKSLLIILLLIMIIIGCYFDAKAAQDKYYKTMYKLEQIQTQLDSIQAKQLLYE